MRGSNLVSILENQGSRCTQCGHIRGAGGGFVQTGTHDGISLLKKFPRFILIGSRLGFHKVMPSVRMAYMSGMRGSLYEAAGYAKASINSPVS